MVSGPLPNINRGRMSTDDHRLIEQLAANLKNPKPGIIARRINRHPATVNWYMLTHGLLPERKVGRAARPYVRNGKTVHPYAVAHDRFILALRVERLSLKEIAKRVTKKFGFERSHHSVDIRLKQLAIDPEV